MKGDQFECNKCGKIFLRLCHYIQHSSFGKCNGVFDDDGNNKIIRRDFSDERKTKIQRTIKMNTPIHYEESDVNACNKSMLESLKQSADTQMPKIPPTRTTCTSTMHPLFHRDAKSFFKMTMIRHLTLIQMPQLMYTMKGGYSQILSKQSCLLR